MDELFPTEPVTVVRQVGTGEVDAFRAPVTAEERTVVEGCLVAQDSTGPASDASAQRAVSDTLTVYFPAGTGSGLRGCSLEVRGRRYAVEGDPFEWPAGACPGPWNVEARCTRRG